MLENKTINQHFISQEEQRVNAKPDDRGRIYKFSIVDRDKPVIQLFGDRGVTIKNNLTHDDLFTFDRQGEIRRNLERLFGKYENRGSQAVETLRHKTNFPTREVAIGNVAYDSNLFRLVFEIWSLKFLNIWRNPHGVKKFLNTFPVSNFPYPRDPYLRECFRQIDAQAEDEVKEILTAFDLNPAEYTLWRKGLLRLLMQDTGDQRQCQWSENLFDELAYDLLIDKRRFCAIELHYLTQDFPGRFVLSDRSYFYGREPRDPSQSFSFNLTGQIAMTFGSLERTEVFSEVVKNDPRIASCPKELINESANEIAGRLQFRVIRNNEAEAARFNERTIFQAKESVFCSQKSVIGSTVQRPPKERCATETLTVAS